MADSVWVSGLLMSTLWIEWPMVAVGLWYGQAYVMDNEHRCIFIDGILNAQRYRDEILRSIVVPFIHDNHLMLQHDNARPHVVRICTQFLEAVYTKCSLTDLDRFVNNICENWIFCVCRTFFRFLSSANEKWEQKQKCCVYIFAHCIWGPQLEWN